MNILVEIPDKAIMIIGIIVVLLIAIAVVIFKVVTRRKIKPIDEEERYDLEDEEDDYSSLSVEDFFKDEKEIPEEHLTEEQIEAKEELQRVFEQMSYDLENQKNDEDEIEQFEQQQEEDAIISYQELLAQAESLKKKADRYERKAEEIADTKVDSAIKNYRKKEEKISSRKVESKMRGGFKNSDIISPIYGVQGNKNMVKLKKKTSRKKSDIISKAYEKDFEEEKTQNLDFLNSLKEFRKNL